MNSKYIIILISVLGLLYVPVSILLSNHNLIQVHATVTKVIATKNRRPYYKFQVKEYPGVFYNSGNGLLSYFKKDQSILNNSLNKIIEFNISENDISATSNNEKFYIGLEGKSKLIDLFYYNFSSYKKFIFSVLCLIMMVLNLYGIFKFEIIIFRFMLISFFSIFLLILLL